MLRLYFNDPAYRRPWLRAWRAGRIEVPPSGFPPRRLKMPKAKPGEKPIRHATGTKALSDDDVREIRRSRRNGITYSAIARNMDVSARTVEKAATGVTYRHVEDVPPVVTKRRKLSDDQVRRMRLLRGQGVSFTELSDRYGLTVPAVRNACARRTYQNVE